MAKRPIASKVRNSLLQHIFRHNRSPVESVAVAFGVSRQAVLKHLQQLVKAKDVVRTGTRKAVRYRLATKAHSKRSYRLVADFGEDAVWTRQLKPFVGDLDQEAQDICQYGLTELVNNSIDHSGGSRVSVQLVRTALTLEMQIADDGIGAFAKVAAALGVPDPRLAVIELSKGRFTTDPSRHTGEGLFFTSRLFDRFLLRANGIEYARSTDKEDPDIAQCEPIPGTFVRLALIVPTTRTMAGIFAEFSSGPDDYRFARTTVPIKLAQFGDESLMSRSSARRVLARIETFDEVALDFTGVHQIGQAFADEIYRVFVREHPETRLSTLNAEEPVLRMIRRAQAGHRGDRP